MKKMAMAALKDKNLWIVVCEGDTKAFPGMNAATARWEALGAKVSRNDPSGTARLPRVRLRRTSKRRNGRARRSIIRSFAAGTICIHGALPMISRACGTGCFGSEQRRGKRTALFTRNGGRNIALFVRATASIQGRKNALE